MNRISSPALEASRVLSTVPCLLASLHGYNSKASAQFIQLHDAAAVPSEPVAGVAQVSTVTTTDSDAAALDGKYFLLSDAAGPVYGWFDVDEGGFDPALADARGIAIALADDDTDAEIASAIAAAFNADAAFTAAAVDDVATITDAATGARTAIAAGDSELAVAVTTPGVTTITAAVPFFTLAVPATSNFAVTFPSPVPCGALSVCNSSTATPKTIGSADCFFTAVLA